MPASSKSPRRSIPLIGLRSQTGCMRIGKVGDRYWGGWLAKPPGHKIFVAGSNAAEYFDAPASWSGRLSRFSGGLNQLSKLAIAKVGVSYAKPFPRTFGARPLLPARLLHRALAEPCANKKRRCFSALAIHVDPYFEFQTAASRAFHRLTTSTNCCPRRNPPDLGGNRIPRHIPGAPHRGERRANVIPTRRRAISADADPAPAVSNLLDQAFVTNLHFHRFFGIDCGRQGDDGLRERTGCLGLTYRVGKRTQWLRHPREWRASF